MAKELDILCITVVVYFSYGVSFFFPVRTGTFSGTKFLGFQTLTRSVGKLEKVETLTRFENKLKKKKTLTICENFHKFRLLTIPAHFIEL